MEVKIQLNGVKAKDGAKVLTGAKIRGDGKCDIQAENIEISGNAELLTDMEKAEEALQELDPSSTEYASLSQVIQTGRTGNRRELLKKIGMHIGMFAEGVLQNIVSDAMCGKR